MAKTRYEDFAKFFENPTREGLREVIRNNEGEFDQLDFKEDWPTYPNLARHLFGFANSGGGCIVIGMKQESDNSLNAIGLKKLADKASIDDGVKKYIPQQLKKEIFNFTYEASEYPKINGKSFQVIIVENEVHYTPFISLAESGNGIRKNAIYVRHGTKTEEANYQQLQEIINRRVESGYSSQNELDLANEFAELKILYDQFLPHTMGAFGGLSAIARLNLSNPDYPNESFEAFTRRMIQLKKERIQRLLTK